MNLLFCRNTHLFLEKEVNITTLYFPKEALPTTCSRQDLHFPPKCQHASGRHSRPCTASQVGAHSGAPWDCWEEQGGGRHRPSILADATESVFAAVYLDGGMDAARDLIHRVLLDKEREEQVEERRRDYKTELQELVQRKSDQLLRYELTGSSGPDHAKEFAFRVTLNGAEIGTGTGRSKKEAEQSAACAALEHLKNEK